MSTLLVSQLSVGKKDLQHLRWKDAFQQSSTGYLHWHMFQLGHGSGRFRPQTKPFASVTQRMKYVTLFTPLIGIEPTYFPFLLL